jgi:hypothetical protein
MGYTTDFMGRFNLDHPLTPEHHAYLSKFSEIRHMERDASLAEGYSDPIRLAAKLPLGAEGAYFVGSGGFKGQDRDSSVIDYNQEPEGQPGIWCQWVPTTESDAIEWDGGEKFYNYVEWLQYLIVNFLAPWGYKLNGSVKWQGERMEDRGKIVVVDNVVTTIELE